MFSRNCGFFAQRSGKDWLTLAHALWWSVCLIDGFQFKNTIKTSHALRGHLLTVSCMRITQLQAHLPAAARGIKTKKRLRIGWGRSSEVEDRVRGEEILVGGGGRRGSTIASMR